MFIKFITRLFKKPVTVAKDIGEDTVVYMLPSDNPAMNPLQIHEAEGVIGAEDVATLNSRLLAPVGGAGVSVRTRALVEMKNGFQDLASHVRGLGQRLHAQTLGQSRLIETLTALPTLLQQMIPNGEEQNRALAALKMAMDEQADAHRVFVDALRPLPDFINAVASMPAQAQQQINALSRLTDQLEQNGLETKAQSDQVRVMVENISVANQQANARADAQAQTLQNFQRANLKGVSLQLKSAELGRKSMRRYHQDMARRNSAQMAALQREQGRYFNRLEEHVGRVARRSSQMAFVGAIMGVIGLVFTVLMMTGAIRLGGPSPSPTVVENPRSNVGGATVGR
ncbi:MAG: hypothetical protein IT462_07655 [Planctomycetes bacterium]|nr:hypothetical protein [Planctomycetota bacterium]